MAPSLPPPSSTASDRAGSASAIISGEASGYHVLRIEDYSRIKSTVPNGELVESRRFRAAEHTWSVRYYPNGHLSENADYISIYLVLEDTVASHLMVQLVCSASSTRWRTRSRLTFAPLSRTTS